MFQFGISQIMFWTAVSAVVVACIRFLPEAVYFVILFTYICVPIGPFAILFATITFSPGKKGYLSVNHGPIKVLVAAWFICVLIAVSTSLLIYWGLIY